MTNRPLILITNDDGIESPGLHAVVAATMGLGDLLIMAPQTQKTSAGRSFPMIKDVEILETTVPLPEGEHAAFTAEVTPAQAVAIAALELAPRSIDLCISGINYGENIGAGVTISGTVGAALEASAYGIPALAMSLEVPPIYHTSYSRDINFTAAAHFTQFFAQKVLQKGLPKNVALLKIDVPTAATPETPWQTGVISQQRYYHLTSENVEQTEKGITVQSFIDFDQSTVERNSDIHLLAVDRVVAVVPVTADLTAHFALDSVASRYK